MSTLEIYGVAPSSYVRTVRMTCAEKGVEHTLSPAEFGSDDHRARHPFVKVPAMKHGDVELFETLAITHYIDSAFDGPSLVPADPKAAAEMYQWISVLNAYAYDDLVRGYLLPFIRNSFDEAGWEDHQPKVERDLKLLDGALEGRTFLAGDQLSLADLFWGAVASPLPKLPHTSKILAHCPNFGPWLGRLMERKSAEFLFPPQG